MISEVLLNYYKRMIDKDQMDLEEVPLEYRKIIENPIEEEKGEVSSIPVIRKSDVLEETENKLGAVTLNSHEINLGFISFDDIKSIKCGIQLKDIFKESLFQSKPKNIAFELIRIENTIGKFFNTPIVEISRTEERLNIEIIGELATSAIKGINLVRLDFNILTSNYEDMKLTVNIKN